MLGAAGFNTPNVKLLLEKPFGVDLASAKDMIGNVARSFDESQIYRIDHYLAKEMSQNIVAFRRGNAPALAAAASAASRRARSTSALCCASSAAVSDTNAFCSASSLCVTSLTSTDVMLRSNKHKSTRRRCAGSNFKTHATGAATMDGATGATTAGATGATAAAADVVVAASGDVLAAARSKRTDHDQTTTSTKRRKID